MSTTGAIGQLTSGRISLIMILLADDQPVAMAGLRTLLAPTGIALATASSPEETLQQLAHGRPRLVITGFFLTAAGRAAINLIRELRQRLPDVPLLVRAPVDDPHLRVGLRALGASGLIATSADQGALHEAVRTILVGGEWFTPTSPGTPLLSPRDLAILQQLREDTGHKGAACTVGTSRTAVDKRLARLRQRFGVGSTGALVAYMVERGLAHLPPESLATDGQDSRTAGQQDSRTAGQPMIAHQAPRHNPELSDLITPAHFSLLPSHCSLITQTSQSPPIPSC